jgi:hypothetical protein
MTTPVSKLFLTIGYGRLSLLMLAHENYIEAVIYAAIAMAKLVAGRSVASRRPPHIAHNRPKTRRSRGRRHRVR